MRVPLHPLTPPPRTPTPTPPQAFPDAYIRLVAFDASRQVQVAGFLVHRPASASEWKLPSERSV